MDFRFALTNNSKAQEIILNNPLNKLKVCRVVTKILGCQVNTKSRGGMKQLGVSFGSIFFHTFRLKVVGGHIFSRQEKSPAPNS